MCGRYYVAENDPDEILAAYIAEAQKRADAMDVPIVTSGEVRPTNIATVIAPNAKNRRPAAFPMKWGFIHPTRGMLVFNTRSETADEKPLFSSSVEDRRCLIPASCYFEWQKSNGRKIKYAIKPKGEPLYLAGLYVRSSKERLPSFSILTMDSADSIKAVHARMPVMIPQGKIDDWLSAEMSYRDVVKNIVTDLQAHIA